eukprot:CAMPEP_0177249068 /NCGR_PEP_ID=MMETSP0367-20130122/52548_1 /TAXON_ID=447022 ORGANISM="Scrippsiella hangoei-like, Strain SHHI-4" /NCGR_SAMPLE_ID=MMETSP0367 /ASSEMBLY_ACC=CAM_ASM_000362 /LENGTH=110 /DNA_ID=CAMNT_0018701535 /DNA_START=237 /DNA_END=569 /DNA_ORIENTATION=+
MSRGAGAPNEVRRVVALVAKVALPALPLEVVLAERATSGIVRWPDDALPILVDPDPCALLVVRRVRAHRRPTYRGVFGDYLDEPIAELTPERRSWRAAEHHTEAHADTAI